MRPLSSESRWSWVLRRPDSGYPAAIDEAILLTLPYLIILWRLAGPMYKRALAMAVTLGAAGSVISFLILVGSHSSRTACFMVSQLALVTIAVVTYYSMEREAGDTRTLMMGFAATAIYGVIFLLGAGLVAILLTEPSPPDQASALGSIRTLNTSEVTYSSTYTQGFSPTLAALGPGPTDTAPSTSPAAGLVDAMLAGGKKGGSTFIYTPGPRGSDGIIQTYTISARPIPDCQGKGLPSYFTDQTGVIRMTNEDRPATVHDPPLAG